MKVNRLLLGVLLMAILMPVSAQKIKVTEGKLAELKGISELSISYEYSDLGVGKITEQEYIDKKVNDKNEDEAGTGDMWKESWFNDRPTRYEVKFEELFSKYASGIQSGKDVSAEVNMLVHTTLIEPGYNIGISRRPAYINLTVSFVRNGELIISMEVLKSMGQDAMGADFDTGWRISEAYAKAGKSLGKYLTKAL